MLINTLKLCCLIWIIAGSCYAKSVTDKDIDTQINMLYEKNPILNEKNVHSKTEQQHVILKGCVRNHEEKDLAEDLAGLVDYIDSIDNKIKIASPSQSPSKNSSPLPVKLSDTFISRLVHAKLMLNQSVCGNNIHVKTLNGITFLNGNVTSLKEKNRAYQIAFKTKGVIDVVNNLKVHAAS